MQPTIRPARFPAECEAVRALFRAYQTDAGIDLCFQGFEAELATLPGVYAEPTGVMLVVEHEARLVGCVALKPLAPGTAEMKRLYVEPAARSLGVGRLLVVELLRRARGAGYARVCLDTVPGMDRAQQLYASLGFIDIAPYTPNPTEGVRYMGLTL